MKAALIYFSGTGNTEYVMEEFKKLFEKNNISCNMIDVAKVEEKVYGYDFYVFGSAIHADLYPKYYTDWVKKNVTENGNKKCIIFSTQAAKRAAGADYLGEILNDMGFEIVIKDYIKMPNNYYIVMFKEHPKGEIEDIKRKASKRVEELFNKFLCGEKSIKKLPKRRIILARVSYKLFSLYSKGWARKKLSVDSSLCIKCEKCVKECPTENINLVEGKITFNNQCISCQKCIHKCPVNAFKYKGRTFNQYKL